MAEIYALIDPITKHVKYIGKAKNSKNRYNQHMTRSRSKVDSKTYCYDWIRSLTVKNLQPELLVLDIVKESEWKFWEQHYISLYKSFGFKLTNLNNGGDDISKETIEKAKTTRKQNTNLGINKSLIGTNIQAINKLTGEVKEYVSINECSRDLNINSSRIREITLGNSGKSSYNGWTFKDLSISDKQVTYLIHGEDKIYVGICLKDKVESSIKALLIYSKGKNNKLWRWIKDNTYDYKILQEVDDSNKHSVQKELVETYIKIGYSSLHHRLNNN